MGEFDSPAEDRYLGPYKIDKIIGRGGMGSVYRAHHASTGEEVAIKLIAQHVADDARFRRRFDAEVETLKRLRHDGIVRLIGYGEEDGRLFYSMEMVHGQPLQQHIRKVKRMSWLASVDIA
ncbi:MAG: protein kinase, partial [Planctomycetota bacterium]